jgi:hypothetical protein
MDQDPLGLSTRKVIGPYSLKKSEGEVFYLQKNGVDRPGGGLVEGTILAIGWTNGVIYAKRLALSRGDPDGWMVVDATSGNISGPLSDSDFKMKYPHANTFPPEEAWTKL